MNNPRHLHGHFFDIALLNYAPYTNFPNGDTTNFVNVTGFSIDLLALLKTTRNFTYQLHYLSGFGAMDEAGTWNGVVGAIQRKEVDFAASLIQ